MRDKTKITPAAHRRHIRIFKFFKPIVTPIFKAKFNYTYDSLEDLEGPYLLLANHNTDFDPILLGMATVNQLYFVASEHVMRSRFWGSLLRFAFAPILHYKGKAGVNTISNMLRTLKAGWSVAIFPEGNRSFNGRTCDFLPTIGKLARKSGAKLITYRTEGGYLSQPRWGFSCRKGKMTGKLIHIYSIDELKNMTDDEVNEAIVRDLYEDAFETQKREHIRFIGKRPAYGLETTLFACPKCRTIGRFHSSDTHLECECGYHLKYTEYGELIDENNPDKVTTVAEMDDFQKNLLREKISESTAPLFEDEVTIMKISKHNIKHSVTSTLYAYADHFEFNGVSYKKEDLTGFAIRSRNTIVTYLEKTGEHFEVKGTSKVFCALKYLYLYEML